MLRSFALMPKPMHACLRGPGGQDAMAAEKDREPISTGTSSSASEARPSAHNPLVHFPLFEQLKRRNVFRALSPDLAAAHIARGVVLHEIDFDRRGAEAEFGRAMELAPNDGGRAAVRRRNLRAAGGWRASVARVCVTALSHVDLPTKPDDGWLITAARTGRQRQGRVSRRPDRSLAG